MTVVMAAAALAGCVEQVPTDQIDGMTVEGANSIETREVTVYVEGGFIRLNIQGQTRGVEIDDANYNPGELDGPDYITLFGDNTRIELVHDTGATITESDETWEAPFDTLVGSPFTIRAETGQPLRITIPDLGTYPVVGGTMTMTSHEHGGGEVVKWEGSINVMCQTGNGPASAPGTFSIGIVPQQRAGAFY